MQRIPLTSVRSWTTYGHYKQRIPASISSACPHCGEKGVFSCQSHLDDQVRNATVVSGNCPACQQPVHFWAIRDERQPKGNDGNPSSIYMYPEAHSYYSHPDFLSDIPEPLARSFVSTVDALNSSNFAATTVCARRTLEGIFKYLVPEKEQKKPLAQLIEHVKSNNDLAAPLQSLSHAIRDGGNLGAHFDMEKEPDAVIARQMVELLEYLISYLYVLPKEINALESSLNSNA